MSDNTNHCQGYEPIQAYAMIGDCHTGALVSKGGSIDWYCPLRFDAPAVFFRLLDANKGGYCRLSPAEPFSVNRAYLPKSNVLQTVFTGGDYTVRLTDFMPLHRRQTSRHGHDVGTSNRILRLVEGVRGETDINLALKPTFDFGRCQTNLLNVPGRGAIGKRGGEYMTLACTPTPLEITGAGEVRATFRLHAGERYWFALVSSTDPDHAQEALSPADGDEQLARTLEYWEQWAKVCTYRGPYYDEVLRSALTLKMLIYEPTGALVAAPTTSLPESIGGVRNWDYRFTWLRDASLILYALSTIGYDDEETDFFQWLCDALHDDPTEHPQVMYTIGGRHRLPEKTLEHLEGYRCSRPVRLGNAAAKQLQLDIYGELLNAADIHFRRAIPGSEPGSVTEAPPKRRVPKTEWTLLRRLVEQAASRWQEPDNGIWEMRAERRPFVYSRLMCWVALDRGIELAGEFGLPAPVEEWKKTREDIRRAILSSGFNPERQAFVQAFGGADLDASALAIPRVGFLAATDSQVRSTVDAIRANLMSDGLVDRYHGADGLPGSEGAFLMCTFWLVDALSLGGRLEEAHDLFERAVSYANDVGLFSEEVDPHNGDALGNFPQGFTHMSLIRSVVNLAKAAKHGEEGQPETEAKRAGRAESAASAGATARQRR
ncbi:MAG: glycoside hydrolase family 15 protein [Dehalococcoidales bacterium]|nr:glycoside hydrolase family 15 protein [Dehalococcoidales bacterium]